VPDAENGEFLIDGMPVIGKMETESGFSGAILRYADLFTCESPIFESFGEICGFSGG